MACRNMEKGEEARREIIEETQSDSVLLKELNLSSFESIQKFAKDFNESKNRKETFAGIVICCFFGRFLHSPICLAVCPSSSLSLSLSLCLSLSLTLSPSLSL